MSNKERQGAVQPKACGLLNIRRQVTDPSVGKVYYYNRDNKVSQWDVPDEFSPLRILRAGVNAVRIANAFGPNAPSLEATPASPPPANISSTMIDAAAAIAIPVGALYTVGPWVSAWACSSWPAHVCACVHVHV
jgi:hypothetical protein